MVPIFDWMDFYLLFVFFSCPLFFERKNFENFGICPPPALPPLFEREEKREKEEKR